MQVTIDKDKFIDSLFYISKTIPKKPTSVYGCIQFLFRNKHLYLYACSGDQFCELDYGDIEADNLSCLVPFNSFSKIIENADSNQLIFNFDNNSLIILDGKNEYRLQWFVTPSDFSHIFSTVPPKIDPFLMFSLVKFGDIFSFLGAGLPTEARLYNIQGVYYDGNFVTANSVQLACYPYNRPESVIAPMFIPTDTFKLLVDISAKVQIAYFYNIGNTIMISVDNARYIVRSFGQVPQQIPALMARVSTHKYGATMNKELLKKKCRKLIPLSSIPQCPAVLTFTPEELSIDVFSETKRGKDYLPIATTTITQTIDFSVNLSSFLEILGKVSSSDVIITFDDELRNYAIRDGVAWYIDLTRISR